MYFNCFQPALFAALLIGFGSVGAQTPGFASGPIRIVVASTAGGSADLVARTLSSKLGEILGTTVIVDNNAGRCKPNQPT